MSKIKTRDATKDIKVFDRAANVGKHMKDAYVKSKDAISSVDRQAERTQDAGHNSPSEYASDQIMGDGKVLEASSSKGRILIRNLWESSGYPIFMFARL